MQPHAPSGADKSGQTAWLSSGFEQLLYELGKHPAPDEHFFDVVIVGSGYGGAIAAAELAGCTHEARPVSLCVLERGLEYLPGMFPSRMSDLPGHVRFSTTGSARPQGRREGLFDIRIGEDVSAVVANGLGGGSLFNAGVMERPRGDAFADWPDAVKRDLTDAYFEETRRYLDAKKPVWRKPPDKLAALKALAVPPARFEIATISVSLKTRRNRENVAVTACKRCGDCATGCNHGAKNSLDVGPLVRARRAGARICTGVTVLRVERDRQGRWVLHTTYTDERLRKKLGQPVRLRARKVILAAGTYGSSEILLRSQSASLRFSRHLGQHFSTNGDAIAVVYDQGRRVNAVADDSSAPDKREIGPTITGLIDLRGPRLTGCVIEEVAVPGPLRRLFEETVTTTDVLHALGSADTDEHFRAGPPHDPCAVNARKIENSSIVVMMADDGAAGVLELVGKDVEDAGDGAIAVRWPAIRSDPFLSRQVKALKELVDEAAPTARILPNPVWQLLPSSLQFLLDNRSGPLLTVHPLGGCIMGRSAADGVVNEWGQVFNATTGEVWPDLVVLDGSIVRNALAINPALTISALARRAVAALRSEWGFDQPKRRKPRRESRPSFRPAPPHEKPDPTRVAVVERMSGDVQLRRKGGGKVACRVELTLEFEPHALADLVLRVADNVPMARVLKVSRGQVRVFRRSRWLAWHRSGAPNERLDRLAELTAPIGGTLTLLTREPTSCWTRFRRGSWAWLCNRGMRDIWQAFADRGPLPAAPQAPQERAYARIWSRLQHYCKLICSTLALATRAGEVRELTYRLNLDADAVSRRHTVIDACPFKKHKPIEGLKRLTYCRRANPWRQLTLLSLKTLPGMRGRSVLALDTKYLADEGVPLLKIVSQNDQVTAMADLASLFGYFLRLFLNIHIWSFRRPDAALVREPQRLPQAIKGRLPEPRIREIGLEQLADGTPVRVRLTRYCARRPQGRPIVMIHGYSASGTTFAHHAVDPNMAEYFYARQRDVWILDLRTSSGMPTARLPWAFEHAALADIPVAIDAIWSATGGQSLDIFAHCMGSAMFSMAVLAPPASGERFFAERESLPSRIHSAVLCQIAPVVVMSPANVFRGYMMSYLRHLLPLASYEFRVGPDPGLMDQLVDRLLATLPYPEEEFGIENPIWPWRRTRFVGTRHRMDALYGRDFSLADRNGRCRLSAKVLAHIDDLFGPLSIETVSQAIHFARNELITNRAGRNLYVQPRNLHRWTFRTASIHGEENGLADVATLARFRKKFREEGGIDIETKMFPGFGHQDCLIGKDARMVFEYVFEFMTRK